MKLRKSLICAVAGVLFAPAAFAAGVMGNVSAYLTNSEISNGASDDGTGFGIKGWVSPNGSFFGHGEYQTTELDAFNIDLESLRIGGGYFMELAKGSGVYGSAEYVSLGDLGGPDDEDGFGVHGGIVWSLSQMVYLNGELGYLSLNESDGIEFLVGGGVNITRQFGLFLDYRMYMAEFDGGGDADVTDLRAGGSFSFGM